MVVGGVETVHHVLRTFILAIVSKEALQMENSCKERILASSS